MKIKSTRLFCIILVICCATIFSGCGEFDKKIVKDADNNYYLLIWSMGDVYYINKLEDYKEF